MGLLGILGVVLITSSVLIIGFTINDISNKQQTQQTHESPRHFEKGFYVPKNTSKKSSSLWMWLLKSTVVLLIAIFAFKWWKKRSKKNATVAK